MILTGKQPEDEQQPVESVKLETGTRLGTVKLTVDGKTTDNILIKGLAKKNILGNLNDKYAAKDHKHKEYLKPSEVNITGTGQDGEVVFTEAIPPDTTNGTLTLKMKEGQQFERIIDLPFTGLKHLAFADKLTSYPDEMDTSFYNDMCTDLNQDLEFVSTTRDSTISGGSLTIASSGGQGGDLICEDITASGDVGVTGDVSADDITATGNVTGAGFVVPNTTDASTKFLLANGGVDGYGRDWYMKRGSASGHSTAPTKYWYKVASYTTTPTANRYTEITLLVSSNYRTYDFGILYISFQYMKSSDNITPRINWATRNSNVVLSDYVLTWSNDGTNLTVNLYCYGSQSYRSVHFTMLDEMGIRGAKTNLWTLYDATYADAVASIPEPSTNQLESSDESYAATAGNVTNMQFTGTCDTAATAQQKEATVDSSFTLTDGVIVAIKFTNTNTFSATASAVITLNVNNTGAKQIWYGASSANTGVGTSIYGYADRYITYMYDATNDVWVWLAHGADDNTNTQIRVYRQTSSYNNDYPILVSRTLASSIGTVGTNSSYSAVYGVIFNTDQPTINPNTGKMKVKALAVNGVDITGNSDERLKDIQGNVSLSIEDIANAPSILYKRKDSDDEKVHIGSIAQYWEKIAPWAVGKDNDGMLTLDYPALSLAASIQCAREIVDLKKRIEKLEERL